MKRREVGAAGENWDLLNPPHLGVAPLINERGDPAFPELRSHAAKLRGPAWRMAGSNYAMDPEWPTYKIKATPDYESVRAIATAFGNAAAAMATSDDPYVAYCGTEHLAKWTLEEAVSPGWDRPLELSSIIAKAPLPPSAATMRFLTEWAGRVTDEDRRMPSAMPRRTNHSDPTWRNDDLDLACHVAMGEEAIRRGSVMAVARDIRRLMSGVQLPDMPVLTTYMRTGPIKKPQALLGWVDGRIAVIGRTQGVFARARQVRGASTWMNSIIRPYAVAKQRRMKAAWPGFKHDATPLHVRIRAAIKLTEAHGFEADVWSDDISAFDLSVTAEMTRMMRDIFYSDMSDIEREVMEIYDVAHALAGGWEVGQEAATYERRGGIVSGGQLTTLDGTIINMSVIVPCLAAAFGWSEARTLDGLRTGVWSALVSGDDTLLVIPKGMNEEKYVSTAKAMNMTRKLSRIPVFLMTYADVNAGISYGPAARAACRTRTSENRYAGPHAEITSAAIRWSRCALDPLRDAMFELMLTHCPLMEEFGIRDYRHLMEVTATPKFIKALEAEREADARSGAMLFAKWANNITTGDRNAIGVANADFVSALLQRFGILRAAADARQSTLELAALAAEVDWRAHIKEIYPD